MHDVEGRNADEVVGFDSEDVTRTAPETHMISASAVADRDDVGDRVGDGREPGLGRDDRRTCRAR